MNTGPCFQFKTVTPQAMVRMPNADWLFPGKPKAHHDAPYLFFLLFLGMAHSSSRPHSSQGSASKGASTGANAACAAAKSVPIGASKGASKGPGVRPEGRVNL